MDHLLALGALGAAAVAFVCGLLLTAITGSAKPVKIFLVVVSLIAVVAVVVGFILSRGLLFYLLFQLIAAMLVLFLIVTLGAVCGGGIYLLRHKKPRGRPLSQSDLADYLPSAEFATLEGITEERAVARILSGYYRGGLHEGAWYIHHSEQSPPKARPELV